MSHHRTDDSPEAASARQLALDSAELVSTPRVEASSHRDRAELHMLRWVEEHRLVDGDDALERFAAIRCGSRAAHAYPRASRGVVELGADVIAWLFLFDDAYGEQSSELVALERVLKTFEPLAFTGELPHSPGAFHHALFELRERLICASDAQLVHRFAYSLRRYFDACLLEFPYRKGGRSPSLAVYRSLRRWSVGVQPMLDLVELTLPRPLDAMMASSDRVWGLRDHAATLCAWASDLYSFQKERRDHEPLNLVSVLIRERGLSIDQAFVDAVQIYNRDLGAFERACEQFTTTTDSLEAAYVRGVRDWVFGTHQWTRQPGRSC